MPSSPDSPPYPTLKDKPIDQWKVTELKDELRRRKVSARGVKDDLINRLRDCIYEDSEASKQETDSLNKAPDQEETLKDSKPIKEDPTGNQNVNAEADSIVVDNDESKNTATADQGIKVPIENFVATADLNVALEEVCLAIPMDSNAIDNGIMQTGKKSMHVEGSDDKKEKGIDEKSDIINYKENDKTNKDLEPLTGESGAVDLNQSEQNNQVSEVKPDLGFSVKCESISTDSVSINEKNELKDNLNADNFHLELEVVKPENVQPSSGYVAPIDGDLHPMDIVREPSYNQGSSEGNHEMEDDLYKKNNSIDRGYSEKLNLDRSSGDESMEEDVSESKQIQSNVNPEINEDAVDVEDVDLKEPSQSVGVSCGLSTPKKDVAKEENKPITHADKRKSQEKESVRSSVPSKRHRCWNIETVKVPEQQISNLTSSTIPTGLGLSTPKCTFGRSDSKLNGDAQKERTVPPSQKPPTNSLRIDHFLRPFTLKAVQELLGKTGTVCSFWMDNIKTHCYVTYSSEEEAIKTRDAVYNLQWPTNGGRILVADFTDPQQVKKRVEGLLDSPAPVTPYKQNQHLQRPHGLRQQQQQLPPPPPLLPPPPPMFIAPPVKEGLIPLLSKNPEPPILTLDDLFIKTKTTPRVYYLPLSEEQVAAKKTTLVKSSMD